MNFPLGNPQSLALDDAVKSALASALGANTEHINAVSLCGITKKLVVEFEEVDQVLALNPSPSKLMEVSFPESVRGVICTSGNTTGHSIRRTRLCFRYFA